MSFNDRVLCPAKIERKKRDTKITGFAAAVVLRLHMEEPSRSKCSYHNLLFHYTGIYVHENTINNFFLHGLPHRGSMVKPKLVPLDKFSQQNVADMLQFVDFIVHERPCNIKFGNEKNLKWQELSVQRCRGI
jgi:hypothetical protein